MSATHNKHFADGTPAPHAALPEFVVTPDYDDIYPVHYFSSDLTAGGGNQYGTQSLYEPFTGSMAENYNADFRTNCRSNTPYVPDRDWDLRVGDRLRDITGWHSKIELQQKMATTILPLIQGGMLLIPYVGITNDAYTLKNGYDIYGNEATEFDCALGMADIVTFGLAKYLKARTKIQVIFNQLNLFSTISGSVRTIMQSYGE